MLERVSNIIRFDILNLWNYHLIKGIWLWGMGTLQTISAQNMDYVCEVEIEEKIRVAIAEGLEAVKDF